MATCAAVIKTALQHLGVIGPSEDPEAEQAVAGLTALQSLYMQWIEAGTFGAVTDSLTTVAGEGAEGTRVAYDGDYGSTIDVTLPVTVEDEFESGYRAPRDLALSLIATSETNIYDASEGEWIKLNDLVLTDEAPLSKRFDIPALLAVSWPYYSRYSHPGLERRASQAMRALTGKFLNTRAEAVGSYY
jgi:hypothetical protein